MTAVLEFDHVARTFPGPPQVEALKDCSMTITAGELLTICGPSGSGKSTWMGLAGLLDRPTAGTVRIRGLDTSSLPDGQRSALRGQWLGLVFQAFHLVPSKTVADNICMGGMYSGLSRTDRRQRAARIGERVGLGHRLHSLARNLSGGEMQRTAIARALLADPALLLCDEPTGNLDSANSSTVMTLLRELNAEGTTIAVITHDPQVAASGTRRVWVRDGIVSDHDER